MFSISHLLIVLLIVLVIFGAGKLPEIGSGLGKAISNFRKSTQEGKEIDVTPGQSAAAGKDGQKSDKPSA